MLGLFEWCSLMVENVLGVQELVEGAMSLVISERGQNDAVPTLRSLIHLIAFCLERLSFVALEVLKFGFNGF